MLRYVLYIFLGQEQFTCIKRRTPIDVQGSQSAHELNILELKYQVVYLIFFYRTINCFTMENDINLNSITEGKLGCYCSSWMNLQKIKKGGTRTELNWSSLNNRIFIKKYCEAVKLRTLSQIWAPERINLDSLVWRMSLNSKSI